jgi:chemotaxis protein CheX
MSSSLSQSAANVVHPDPHWKGILECAAIEVFSMMVGVELKPIPDVQPEPQGEQTAMVGLAGALCGMVTIRCKANTAAKLATLMMGADAASNPSDTGDALGELCNMVAGNFKSKITGLADHCMLSVPTVIWGEDYVMQTATPNEGYSVALTYEGEPVWFALVIHV